MQDFCTLGMFSKMHGTKSVSQGLTRFAILERQDFVPLGRFPKTHGTKFINQGSIRLAIQWNSVTARADGPGTFSRYCRVLVIPKWRIYQGKQREIILAPAPSMCSYNTRVVSIITWLSARLAMWWGLRHTRPTCGARTPTAACALEPDEDERRKGDYTLHKDAPFVVFLCYRPPRDVPYRELDDEVGVGRVARTFVTRKDRKSLVITKMIIH